MEIHKFAKLDKKVIKLLFMSYLKEQLNQDKAPTIEKYVGVVSYLDLIVDFTTVLLDKIHPVSIAEDAFNRD